MKNFNWLLFLEKFTFSLFVLTIFMAVINKIGFGMNLLNFRFILTFTIILSLLYFFLKLRSFHFNLKKLWKFIEDKSYIISKITKKYRTSLVFRRLVDWLVIPLLLIILGAGVFLNNTLHQKEPFSVLVQSQNKSTFLYGKTGEILAGEKINGEFRAIEDNLGIVSVRFTTFNRINNDILLFKIREKWEDDWYYKNEYKVDQFQSLQLFPFGFPIIADSKDKIYQFEIESIKGVEGDAVSLTGPLPVFQAKYQFSKDKILSSRYEKINFAHKKLLNLMSNRDFSVTSIIFFYPFFFYLLWYFLGKKYLKKPYILIYFIFLGILLDGTLVSNISNQVNLLLICLWFLTVVSNKMNYKFSIYASLFSLFICFVLLLFGNNIAVSKISNWIYFFLVIAMTQFFLVYLGEKFKNAEIRQK